MPESSLVEATFWNLRRILIRTGESSVVDFVLFVPEAWVLRLWWATAWHSYFTSLTWKYKLWTKSTANSANHSAKKWENGDKQSHNSDTIWQNVALNATEESEILKYCMKQIQSQKSREIQLYCKPPERWPNWGRRVRRLSWNYLWRKFLSKWLQLGLHAWAVPMIPHFACPKFCMAVKMTFKVEIPLF